MIYVEGNATTKINGVRVVTPQEAQQWFEYADAESEEVQRNLAHTVVTEPDRTRAAVVKAIRKYSRSPWDDFAADAKAIENGADF